MTPAMDGSTLIGVRGDLEVVVTSVRTGKVRKRYLIKNTITYLGVAALLELMTQDGAAPSTFQFTALQAGTTGLPPTRGDTSLGSSVITKAFTSANRVKSLSTGTVSFQTSLGPLEAVGQDLREAGLFLASGTMFSRQTHPTIPKTSGISVSYIWRITITV